MIILSIILFAFAPFAIVKHKEMRFLIPLLPFLYMVTAYGIISFFKNFKFKKTIIFSLIVLWMIFTFPNLKFNQYHNNLAIHPEYLSGQIQSGEIWASNPIYAIYLNNMMDELIYYPTFNHEKFLHLKKNINKAGTVLLNTCDLYCEPYNDYCEPDKMELITLFKNNLKMAYYKKESQCESFVFSR